MQHLARNISAGVTSGGLTCAASIYTLAITNAFAAPRDFPIVLWDAVVVFGIGATLVALLIHFLVARLFAARPLPAFSAFAVTVVAALAAADLLSHGGKVLAAWLIGAVLSSLIHTWLRPNNSFKPNPLRGSA
ncbi:hypothetical protein [Pseudoxanthomonas sacheonensis]|uniref:Uncharacterized protein n=1 Tax=Pseudoxanthomonas sacheonensis TaxID=443615 RepID=A0ABU1RRV1_9GAMM|nr:hypothetical protein [Pseudoxanthomonas sacheonensis]MDR6841511.1 hypothetical protein [Pseudoxanthomonas sacheonensis]